MNAVAGTACPVWAFSSPRRKILPKSVVVGFVTVTVNVV
jgi:hypothetical protein